MELELNETARESLKPMFDVIDSYEILEMLKIDYEEGICVDLIECNLKDGIAIEDLKFIGQMEIMSVLKSEDRTHTCLVKYYEKEELKDSFKETDFDLIASKPTIITRDKITVSYIGENENLKKFIDLVKEQAGTIVNMSFKKAVYQRQDLLSLLTDKQREILVTAYKNGYYEYPKKINSKGLADKVNISKATLVQHLRKAEGRIVAEIMDGYLS